MDTDNLATILRDILEELCAGGCCNHGPKENYDIESSYDLREVVKQFFIRGRLNQSLKDTEELADKEALRWRALYDKACIEIAGLRDQYSDWDRSKYT